MGRALAMTVGIAALARSGNAIVAMADRRLTYGDNELVTSMMATKMLRLPGGFWTLFAGDPTVAETIVGGVEEDSGHPVRDLRAFYAQTRETMVTRQILEPRLLNKDLYIARPNTLQPLDDRFRSEIDKDIREYRLDCQLLSMGFIPLDKGMAGQLVVIDEPGARIAHAYEGFACIGSGASAALSALIFSEIDPNDDIDVQLYQLLYAKAHSEMTPFVGFEGDGWVLLPGQEPTKVSDEIMKLLDRVLEEKAALPFQHRKEWERRPGWEKLKRAPSGWEKRLKDYVDGVAGKWREAT